KVIGKYSIAKKDFSGEVETKDLEFSDYWNNYITTWLESSKVHSGLCNTSLKLHLKNFETLSVKGDVAIEGLKADINNIVLMGDYKTTGSLSTHMNDFSRLTYNLKLEVNKANIATSIKALKSIEDIKGSASLSEKKWIFKNLSCSSYGSQASIRGNITSPHKDFTIDAELESILQLKNIRDLVNMDLRTGEAKVKTKIIYKKDKSYHVSGRSDIEDLTFRQKDITVKGNFVIEGESSGTAGDWEKLKYKGTMKFSNAIIEGSSPLALISDASGNATFDTDRIFIKQFEGKTADASIFLRGDIRRQATGPHFDVNINTNNISLAKLISSLPESAKNKFKGIDIKGSCSIDLNLSGIAGKSDSYNYTGKLLLRESTLALPYWPHKLSNISCDLNFEKQKISWQNFYFDINDIRYNSYGRLINFAHPEVAINLKSKDLEAVAEIRTDKNNIINLSKLSVRYRKSTLSASGKLSNIKSAYANLAGNLNLDLKDAPYIFSSHKEKLDKFKAEGILNVKFTMKGPLKDPASWTLFAEGSSGNLRAWGLSLDDFYFDYRMKDKFIDIPVIVAYPYSGIININSRANLKTEEQPYIINIDIKDIDLQQLIKDSSSKDKKIKGTFAAKSVLNGYLKQGGSMQGSGWLQVSDGYLWEFPIMHGMMEVVFMMPPEYVTLTDAFGNFTVRNNRIHTEDFKMLSKTASLLWVGSLGFDTTLDFNITGRFAEDIIKQTTEPGKIASAILREAGNLIMEIRLTGTLAKPTYQIIPFPLKRIFQEKVVDSLRTIFGNMSE
ncbi:MAG: hypothetical protein HQ572_01205, partial [Candidatus Omnitrophica bacterium]|nr:hypothetical protein [Candidatus Omnitrophota bacterium]